MTLSNLCLAYDKRIILKNINLKSEGHFTVLGANGSGKSTLAKALCGLLSYKGSILIDGLELKEMEARDRAKKIAYIPSKMQSFEEFTSVCLLYTSPSPRDPE